MTVQIQAGSVVQWNGTIGPSPLYHELNVTVAAGQGNRCIYVVLSPNYNTATLLRPKCNGVEMSVAREMATDPAIRHAIYYALAPAIGTAVIRVESTSWVADGTCVTAFCADGVDQTTPNGSYFEDIFWGDYQPKTKACSVATGGIVIGSHGIVDPTVGSLTLESGQTAIGSLVTWGANHDYRVSYKPDATVMGISWTGTYTQGSQLLLAINPASGGSADGSATGATLTGTSSLTAGSATGTAAGSAAGVTLTGTSSLSAGAATGNATGSFTTAAMENNTGAGLLANTAVEWTWYQGVIGSAPASTVHGTGTTNASGVLTVAGLPIAAGFMLVRTTDSSGVYYQSGTPA